MRRFCLLFSLASPCFQVSSAWLLPLNGTLIEQVDLMEADIEQLMARTAEANRRGDVQALADLHHPNALIIHHAQ